LIKRAIVSIGLFYTRTGNNTRKCSDITPEQV
jgi:hypothetical protein